MEPLNAAQRRAFFQQAGDRAGVHAPLLAALHAVHQAPTLSDGEVGLGISPANQVALTEVETLPGQVQVAASTVRSITDRLIAQGWQSADLWDVDRGRYGDRFLTALAEGYLPPPNDTHAAQIEPCDGGALLRAYVQRVEADHLAAGLPSNLAFVDGALLNFLEQVPATYRGLSHERDGLLEAVRLWRKLDSQSAAIHSLLPRGSTSEPDALPATDRLDIALQDLSRRLPLNYAGYPHQREALLRLVQCWRQLPSREAAIASLEKKEPVSPDLAILDPALMAFVQRLPAHYLGKGEQRNALTETFRLWQGLDSRTTAVRTLGVDPEALMSASPAALLDAARQLDQQLLRFVQRIPAAYRQTDAQRVALLHLVQTWRGLETGEATVRSLVEDLRRLQAAHPGSLDAMPAPVPDLLPVLQTEWALDTIQLHGAIAPGGRLTWAEATQGGLYLPKNLAAMQAIVRLAKAAEQVATRLGRSLHIIAWHCSPEAARALPGPNPDQHTLGSALLFYCDGLTAQQIYWTLDPWWTGGLGRFTQYPALVYLESSGAIASTEPDHRVRWVY
ncbi:peptidase M15A [Thermoleptolyngbya sp. C42_A2020_037]|uniref:peptidase M15A n=1 Tax=Thermoleptolyngbya sp. C42_A2020_037 TaxID=2747799 RepID=UPI0019E68E45|nr:peptidase M15A [Thermoleptolyngbya sp. C42_A2020_037]MBF2086454.1 peptidase M15A [Thermoleptolyngbya sp. C42_A2020_037]